MKINFTQRIGLIAMLFSLFIPQLSIAQINDTTGTIVLLNGGMVSTEDGATDIFICSSDGISDATQFVTNAINTDDVNYVFIMANSDGSVIAVSPAGFIEFEGSPSENCRIYGLAYTGELLLMRDDNIFTATASTGDFVLSDNFVNLTVQRGNCDESGSNNMILNGGFVSTITGDTSLFICSGDGVSDTVRFVTDAINITEDDINYVFVMANNDGSVISVSPEGFIEFEGSPSENCRIYGLAYTGELLLMRDDNIFTATASTGDFAISDNFVNITVQQGDCSGGMLKGNFPNKNLVQSAALSLANKERNEIIFKKLGRLPTAQNESILTQIYPNPATEVINLAIHAGQDGLATIALLNSVGKMIKTQTVHTAKAQTTQMAVDDLIGGIYHVQIRLHNQVIQTEKVVIIR